MPLTLKGSLSGGVTIDVPATAGNNTLTFPAATGTALVGTTTTANQVFFGGATSGTLSQSSNLVWDNTNGKLSIATVSGAGGIGLFVGNGNTANFTDGVHVQGANDGSAGGYTAFSRSSAADYSTNYINMNYYNNGNVGFIMSGTALSFCTGVTTRSSAGYINERMRIASDGLVGIGGIPQSPLYVGGGNESIGQATYKGQVTLNSYSSTLAASNIGIEYKVRADSNGYGWRTVAYNNSIGFVDYVFQSRQGTASWTDVVTLAGSGGNVGIGTSSPVGKLNLYASTGASILTIQAPNGGASLSGIYFRPYQSEAQAAANPAQAAIIAADNAYSANLVFQTKDAGAIGNNLQTRMTLDASGTLLTGGKTSVTSNSGDIQVSRGIGFPATQVSCSDANTLDDYEEGTWTPRLENSTGSISVSMAASAGRYIKIGSYVWIQINTYSLDVSAFGTSDHIYLANLPFSNSIGVYGLLISSINDRALSIIDGSGVKYPLYLESHNAVDFTPFSRSLWGGTSAMTIRCQFGFFA